MTKANGTWNVLPHGPIESLAENLWWVQGSLPGMSLKRTMVVARLADGGLVIHNGVALQADAMRELEALGTPAYLIVPNGLHRLDAPAYKARYPALRVFAPSRSRRKVEEVVPVDATTAEFPANDVVSFQPLHGVGDAEDAMFVRSRDGLTVVLTDVVFNMDTKRDVLGYLITTLFGSAPGPRVSRLAKLMLVKDKKLLRRELEELAERPDLARLVVAHEKVAHGRDAADALRRAATYL